MSAINRLAAGNTQAPVCDPATSQGQRLGQKLQELLAKGTAHEAEVPSNTDAAIRCYRTAAELGNTEACIKLGKLYWKVQRDYLEAERWFLLAVGRVERAETACLHDEAHCLLGQFYLDTTTPLFNDHKAVYHLQQAGALPDTLAALGRCYLKGWGVPEDFEQGVFLLQRAVERGSADAMSELSARHLLGASGCTSVNPQRARAEESAQGASGPYHYPRLLEEKEETDLMLVPVSYRALTSSRDTIIQILSNCTDEKIRESLTEHLRLVEERLAPSAPPRPAEEAALAAPIGPPQGQLCAIHALFERNPLVNIEPLLPASSKPQAPPKPLHQVLPSAQGSLPPSAESSAEPQPGSVAKRKGVFSGITRDLGSLTKAFRGSSERTEAETRFLREHLPETLAAYYTDNTLPETAAKNLKALGITKRPDLQEILGEEGWIKYGTLVDRVFPPALGEHQPFLEEARRCWREGSVNKKELFSQLLDNGVSAEEIRNFLIRENIYSADQFKEICGERGQKYADQLFPPEIEQLHPPLTKKVFITELEKCSTLQTSILKRKFDGF